MLRVKAAVRDFETETNLPSSAMMAHYILST